MHSPKFCWSAMGAQVAVEVGRQLTAHVSGVQRCGSPWACPVCAPVIRERRAGEIDQGVRNHLDRGGSAEFLTLTLRHGRADALAPRLDAITQALSLVLKGSGWDRRRARLGYVGAIKAVEITHGVNGWHPHAHVLLLFDGPLGDSERQDLCDWIYGRWAKIATDRGFGTVTKRHGVDLRPVTDGDGLGEYLTKVEGGWSAGRELSRSDTKGAAPIQLLRAFVETGEVRPLMLWREYEEATVGKRALRWSPGLRARLLGVEDETSDVELASSEGVDLSLLRALIPRDLWSEHRRGGTTGELLTEVELAAGFVIFLADLWGVELEPLGVPRE